MNLESISSETEEMHVQARTDELHASRQFAQTFVIESLGCGGHVLVNKLEACQSREALLRLLEECRRFIETCVNRKTAQDFWDGLGEEATAVPSWADYLADRRRRARLT